MSLIVYTANLQHGEGTDAATNYQRQMDILDDADLVGVQEKGTSDTGWNTPQSNANMAQAIYRENDSSQGDGNAVWYKTANVTIVSTYETDLSQDAVAG